MGKERAGRGAGPGPNAGAGRAHAQSVHRRLHCDQSCQGPGALRRTGSSGLRRSGSDRGLRDPGSPTKHLRLFVTGAVLSTRRKQTESLEHWCPMELAWLISPGAQRATWTRSSRAQSPPTYRSTTYRSSSLPSSNLYSILRPRRCSASLFRPPWSLAQTR